MTRGKTLAQLKYGEGMREGLMETFVQPFNGCYAKVRLNDGRCQDPPYGSIEIYVDESPPGMGWYERMLRDLSGFLPKNSWARLIFCKGHLEEVVARSLEYLEDPDLWAPEQYAPPVMPRPPKVVNHDAR